MSSRLLYPGNGDFIRLKYSNDSPKTGGVERDSKSVVVPLSNQAPIVHYFCSAQVWSFTPRWALEFHICLMRPKYLHVQHSKTFLSIAPELLSRIDALLELRYVICVMFSSVYL